MRISVGLLLMVSLCLAPFAGADVALRLPGDIKAVAVNGKGANLVGMAKLPDGLNQMAVQLQKTLGKRFDDQEMAYSDVMVVTFSATNETLVMRIPDIKDTYQLEKFNQHKNIEIIASNGKTVPTQVAILKKEGFQIMRDFERELAEFNESDSPAAIPPSIRQELQSVPAKTPQAGAQKTLQRPSAPPTAAALPQAVKTAPPSVGERNMPETMLKYWYQQADDATRQRFKEWINRK